MYDLNMEELIDVPKLPSALDQAITLRAVWRNALQCPIEVFGASGPRRDDPCCLWVYIGSKADSPSVKYAGARWEHDLTMVAEQPTVAHVTAHELRSTAYLCVIGQPKTDEGRALNWKYKDSLQRIPVGSIMAPKKLWCVNPLSGIGLSGLCIWTNIESEAITLCSELAELRKRKAQYDEATDKLCAHLPKGVENLLREALDQS